MKTFLLLLLVALAPRGLVLGQYIYVDVSFKILVKSNGETSPKAYPFGSPVSFVPPGNDPLNTNDQAEANRQADEMLSHPTQLSVNGAMDNSGRGLRYRRYGNVEFVRADTTPIDATFKSRIDSLFRSSYASGFAGNKAYNDFQPASKLLTWGPESASSKSAWRWYDDRANFYLIGGFGGGVGFYPPDNLMVQGGFWVDPATHEFGHWFSLPHTFRANGGQGLGVSYWGDQVSTTDHADGFTDTLIDHVGAAQNLDENAGALYQFPDGTPKNYSELTATEKGKAETRFRNHYANEFFENPDYASLTAAQKQRIPAFDNALPAPTVADRNRLAVHLYGRNFDAIAPGEQTGINNAIASPNANWWIKNARYGAWYCKVDDDLIAERNFNKFFDELDASQVEQIRLLNANIIAYRAGKGSPYGIFSELQLDRLCDLISQPTVGQDRSATRGLEFGKYVFLGPEPAVRQGVAGCSLNPLTDANFARAIAPANSIIIGRPGNYRNPTSAPLVFSKAVTLRATSQGPFTIGRP